ncbi:MAG: hypothetical protein QN168_07880 [Armatimonadota bacterium]|nr:hypothetical protein [Armatimonadota bacterium]
MTEQQITVRARDCGEATDRVFSIGEVLTHRGREWTVVGLFMGADSTTGELEEYLVLEGLETEERVRAD